VPSVFYSKRSPFGVRRLTGAKARSHAKNWTEHLVGNLLNPNRRILFVPFAAPSRRRTVNGER
jgi:hypothetical protein